MSQQASNSQQQSESAPPGPPLHISIRLLPENFTAKDLDLDLESDLKNSEDSENNPKNQNPNGANARDSP